MGRDGDDMTRTQIFLGPLGCGPKIGENRANRQETSRSNQENASPDGWVLRGVVDRGNVSMFSSITSVPKNAL